MRLKDKVAIITGAASGLGRATALRLTQEGARLVLADLDEAGGEETVRLVQAAGGQAVFVRTDVRRWADAERLAQAALDTYAAGIDILINGAGVLRPGQVVDCLEEDWDLTLDVNLKGTFLCCKAVLPSMLQQHSGTIINVSSSAALRPSPDYPAYTAAKMAVMGFTQALAAEVNKDKITAITIRPGVIETPLGVQGFVARRGREPNAEERSHMLKVEDVAGVICHLVDPEMARTTSAVVDVIVP
ncbi:MAG: SDR family oxidoreductase [Anaerolineaceae bacterium]|jgi:NAD(P)-dependent dehydrogenase (short-subunit alcohol dehydrogenase family)|nr:SDR family oxidoreductase [Anaerolineaceae bacterium]